MADTKEKDNISRGKFLKMLCAGAFILATGGLAGLGQSIKNKRSMAQEPSVQGSSPTSIQVNMQVACNYIIYWTGSINNPTYWAQRTSDGKQLLNNGSNLAEVVIQAALDQWFHDEPRSRIGPGHIYIKSGDYRLSKTFKGFNIKSFTRLTLDPTAGLIVPDGYDGYVFRLHSDDESGNITDCIIDGGSIREGIPQRRWTAIQLQGSANAQDIGVVSNKIMNTTIYDAGIGIKLLVDGTKGFVNGNSFQFLKMYTNNIFIDFGMDPLLESKFVPGSKESGIHGNYFQNLQCQCGYNTIHGIKDIRHDGNTFIDVKVWDIQSGAISSNTHEHATGTIIIGGVMTNQLFTDQGKYTKIFDEWQGFKLGVDSLDIPSAAIQIGTFGSQKLGFFGASPVGKQPFDAKLSKLENIYNALKTYGLLS